MSRSRDPQRGEQQAPGVALLIIDMISCWDFPDAEALQPGAAAIAEAIAGLKRRFNAANLPVIYANDNRGRWRSDFRSLVRSSIEQGGASERITRTLLPQDSDFFVLKPKHSAFFGTPLELMLADLDVGHLVLTGVASDQCVLVTALEARMRNLGVHVPADCVASQSDARNAVLLRQLGDVHRIPTTPADRLPLDAARPRPETC